MVQDLLRQVLADIPEEGSLHSWDIVCMHLRLQKEFETIKPRTARDKTLKVLKRWQQKIMQTI